MMAVAQTSLATPPAAASTRPRIWQIGLIVVVVAAAAIAPFTVTSFHLLQLTMVLIYSIALLGLNILTDYNGQISLGHGAFYAIGAYTTAILLERTTLFPIPPDEFAVEAYVRKDV